MGKRAWVGRRGEDVAARFLVDKGYRLVARNYRCRLGEVDIVAYDALDLVFIEVKARTTRAFGFPQEAVGLGKQRKLRALAERYLQENKPSCAGVRFDVVSVLLDPQGKAMFVELIKNAF